MIDDPHIVKGMIPMTDGRSLYRLDSVYATIAKQYQPFAKTIYECFEKAKDSCPIHLYFTMAIVLSTRTRQTL